MKSRRDENLIPPSQLRQRTHPTSPDQQQTEVAATAAEPAAARSSLQQPAAAAVVQSICARKQTTRVDHRVRWRRRNIGAACEGASWCGAQRPVTRRARAPYLPCRRRVQGMRTIAQGTHNAQSFRPWRHGAQMRGLSPSLWLPLRALSAAPVHQNQQINNTQTPRTMC